LGWVGTGDDGVQAKNMLCGCHPTDNLNRVRRAFFGWWRRLCGPVAAVAALRLM